MNVTCRVYIAEEVGMMRNFMDDLAEGSAGSRMVISYIL